MRLVEIRDLDGPNLFLLCPAIKVEWHLDAGEWREAVAALLARLEPLGFADDADEEEGVDLGSLLIEAVGAIHRRAGVPAPDAVWTELETPGRAVLAFAWDRRRFALAVAELLGAVAAGEPVDLAAGVAALPALLVDDAEGDAEGDADAEDRPLLVRDGDRRIPIVGVTGTNGKTTTTRIIAHLLRETGRRVGWSSTAGVYIEGEMVLEGDYSGPAGARRVLGEPGLDVAVLETARGGILLRGLAYESNDVSVLLNLSADHLGLHGVHTVEGLAKVKAVVVRVTRPDGTVVLNADDPLVRGVEAAVRGDLVWISRDADNPTVAAHVLDGGRALVVRDGELVELKGERSAPIGPLADVPLTWGGKAGHMVENVLCAAAAGRALGLSREEVAAGLRTFGSDPSHNPGRLHVYDVGGGTVIVDYAHNEVGLDHLLGLADGLRGEGGRLWAVIGTAGDRTDEVLRGLGRMAAERSDRVIVKETHQYLRGRTSVDEMTDLFTEGIAEAGKEPHAVAESEPAALEMALAELGAGDVVAIMSVEENPVLVERLEQVGRART